MPIQTINERQLLNVSQKARILFKFSRIAYPQTAKYSTPVLLLPKELDKIRVQPELGFYSFPKMEDAVLFFV